VTDPEISFEHNSL